MSQRAHIEAIDRILKDFRCNNNLMGSITFVFAGDFRQSLTRDTISGLAFIV